MIIEGLTIQTDEAHESQSLPEKPFFGQFQMNSVHIIRVKGDSSLCK